jgi:hypothetical protein
VKQNRIQIGGSSKKLLVNSFTVGSFAGIYTPAPSKKITLKFSNDKWDNIIKQLKEIYLICHFIKTAKKHY